MRETMNTFKAQSTVPGMIVILMSLLAAFVPASWRLWGVDGLIQASPLFIAGWIILAFVISGGLVFLLRKLHAGITNWIILALLFAVLVVLPYLKPSATLLRGDGLLYVNSLDLGRRADFRSLLYSPLLLWLKQLSGQESITIFRWITIAASLIYFGAIAPHIYKLRGSTWQLAGVALASFTSVLPVLSGFVEYYALPYALSTLSLSIALMEMQRKRYPFIGLAVLILASLFHFVAIVCLPAFILPLEKVVGRRKSVLAFLMIGLAGFIAALFIARKNLLFPLGPTPRDGYAIWSIRHLIDWINLFFWSVPVVLAGLVFLWKPLKKSITSPQGLVLPGAALGALAFSFLFSPDLGMARDADLMGFFAIPVTLLAVSSLINVEPEKTQEYLVPILLMVAGCVTALPQVMLQADEERSVERHHRQLVRNPGRAGYGWEILGNYYKDRGNQAKEEWAFKEAVKVSPNGRYYLRLAKLELKKGNKTSAKMYAKDAAERLPKDAGAQGLYGHLLFMENRLDQAAFYLNKSVVLRTKDPNHYSMLAYILMKSNRLKEAETIITYGNRRAASKNGQFLCIEGMILEQIGEKSRAYISYNKAVDYNAEPPWDDIAKQGIERLGGGESGSPGGLRPGK